MSTLLDILLITIGSIVAFKAYKSIVFNRTKSVSDYVIIVIYVFCIIPILFNYLIGVPTYQTVYWYKVFSGPMINSRVAIIYDLFIMLTILLLWLYSKKQYVRVNKEPKIANNSKNIHVFESGFLSYV